MRRRSLFSTTCLALLLSGVSSALIASPGVAAPLHAVTATLPTVRGPSQQIITVLYPNGTSAQWTTRGMEGLPRTTVTAADGSTVTGVSLPDLAAASGSQPVNTGKNPQLRTSFTVGGPAGYVRFAGGELDPGYADHPALLTEDADGQINLVVCQDATTARSVSDVQYLRVEFAAPTALPAPAPGSIVASGNGQTITITGEQLASLKQEDALVTFDSSTGTQTHTERGIQLSTLFAALGVTPTTHTLVTAVGSDGYAAEVTMGEALYGAGILGLSLVEDGKPLAQPRLVVIGDHKGGRYVSDVTQLQVVTG